MTRKVSKKSEPEIPRSIDPNTAISLLARQIDKAEELLNNRPLKTSDHTAWNNTTRDYLMKTFGSASPNIDAVISASSDHGLYVNMGEKRFEEYIASKLANQVKMLRSCTEQLETEVELSVRVTHSIDKSTKAEVMTNLVFVVHGQNSGVKETVARFIERLGLEPIILHEKPNLGRTIIEKFSDYSDVHFAVVLLTGDDEGRLKDTEDTLLPRARQNVILELGYFLGKLGRSQVCVLYANGVEIPSDYQGVVFVPLDPQEKWRFDLVQELKAAGFQVDANRIFSFD